MRYDEVLPVVADGHLVDDGLRPADGSVTLPLFGHAGGLPFQAVLRQPHPQAARELDQLIHAVPVILHAVDRIPVLCHT